MPTPGPDGGLARPAVGSAETDLYRRQVPAWLMSLGLHLAFFTAIALIVPRLPQGAAEEAARTGGIVLVHNASGPPQYLSEEDAGGALADAPAQTGDASQATAAGGTPQQPFPDVPAELAGLLPRGAETIAGSEGLAEGADSATAMAVGGGIRGPKLGEGHSYAQTGVFGVTGRGTKFVYVFDRSGSMDGFEGRPLVAAKRELLASLEKLGSVHQFQIVFYNERPTILNPQGSAAPRLMFGNEGDKKLAHEFVRAIQAEGGTRHLDALKLAMKMQPHVIFFLTDADEPRLTNAELDEVRKLNERVGCSINAIEFGSGPQQRSDNFLVRIARENSGAHAYVDVTRLPRN